MSDVAKALVSVAEAIRLHRSDSEENGIAEALGSIGRALRALGNADASTPLGGLEGLGATIGGVREGESLAEATRTAGHEIAEELAEAIRDAGHEIAEAIKSSRGGR